MRRITDQKNGKRANRLLSVLAATAFALILLMGMSVQVLAESEEIPTLNFPEKVTMKIGQTKTLNVDVVPADTSYLVDVDWCSIDETGGGSVDIVDAGSGSYWNENIWVEIEAYEAGTCYIEPDVCIYDSDREVVTKYQARIKVTIEKNKNGYQNVSQAYKELNAFRTTKKVWQWKSNNKSKKYFNTNSKNKLKPLKKRSDLEKTAKKRAKEIAKYFSHTRPNGKAWYTIYPKRYRYMGENIACGYQTAHDVTEAWKEDNEKYSGQGHRRNMLYKNFSYVGIACYEVDGYRYWVQCFGK